MLLDMMCFVMHAPSQAAGNTGVKGPEGTEWLALYTSISSRYRYLMNTTESSSATPTKPHRFLALRANGTMGNVSIPRQPPGTDNRSSVSDIRLGFGFGYRIRNRVSDSASVSVVGSKRPQAYRTSVLQHRPSGPPVGVPARCIFLKGDGALSGRFRP